MLPPGLTLDQNTGAITGIPQQAGTFNFQVTVVDSSGIAAGTQTTNCSITINPPPGANCVSITAVQGVAITPVTLTGSGGSGGPYTFSSNDLPSGLSISTSGTISGTPTVSGTFTYHVTVTDKDGHSGTISCSVTVNPPPTANCVSITAVQGVAITAVTMVGSGGVGGPYTFSSNDLPSGLSISTSGTISGTPTVSGTFTYHVTVTDKDGHTGTVGCSVTIIPALTMACPYSFGLVNQPYSSSITASGGVQPYTFSIIAGSLPPVLTLNPSTGAITGTPTTAGSFSFTAQVVDSSGLSATNTTSSNCGITINPPPPPPQGIGAGDTATIGFWHNKNGQAVINSFNGGSTATALGTWLATNFPNLFGAPNPYTSATLASFHVTSLAGLTNAQVATVYLNLWNPSGVTKNTYVQAFAGALACYATSTALGYDPTAAKYGFNSSSGGSCGHTFNVGSNGAAFGVPNNTTLTLAQVLTSTDANFSPSTGLFYGGDQTKTSDLNNVLNGINTTGDIN
jgi:hypothetical protein